MEESIGLAYENLHVTIDLKPNAAKIICFCTICNMDPNLIEHKQFAF